MSSYLIKHYNLTAAVDTSTADKISTNNNNHLVLAGVYKLKANISDSQILIFASKTSF